MSTNAKIGILYENKVKSVSCIKDGYISSLGKKLYKYYNDISKAEKLIEKGDIVSIGEYLNKDEYLKILKEKENELKKLIGDDNFKQMKNLCNIYYKIDGKITEYVDDDMYYDEINDSVVIINECENMKSYINIIKPWEKCYLYIDSWYYLNDDKEFIKITECNFNKK
jgi:hypothetical protein